MLLPGSPCVDLGHPDGAFEDAWFRPPTTDRNDMGAFGGPENVWAHDGAWEDLGQGLAGTDAKTPTLTTGCPLRDDGLLTYTLENGLPDSSAVYVLGVSLLNAPFRGGTMVPDADVIVPGLPIDGAGNLAIAYSWIPGLPSGVTTWHQFWVVDPGGPLGFFGRPTPGPRPSLSHAPPNSQREPGRRRRHARLRPGRSCRICCYGIREVSLPSVRCWR